MSIVKFFVNFFEAIKPFIVGFFLAYILSVPCSNLDNRLRKKFRKKTANFLSVLIVETIFFCALIVCISLFLPLCIDSVGKIVQNLPNYLAGLRSYLRTQFGNAKWLNHLYLNQLMEDFGNVVQDSLSADAKTMFTQAYDSLLVLSNKVISFVLAMVVNVFFLYDRHNVSKGIKYFVATFIPKYSRTIINGIVRINQVFRKFILGKFIDSCIIGVLTLIVLSLMHMPYSVFAAVTIGVTNMIPIVGPILGAIPGFLLIIGENPSQALLYACIVLVIQQIDGHIIGPKCIGNVTGLNTVWVLFAVFLGGKLFGIWGMFFGVPVFAVFYETFLDYMKKRRATKSVEEALLLEEPINIE